MNQLGKEDPHFHYLSSRNPYAFKILEFQRQFPHRVALDQQGEAYRGLWRSRSQKQELHLEIGCNAGHVLLEWAARSPHVHYVGLDWKFKAIHRAVQKAIDRGIENVTFLRAYAERLDFLFAPQELDAIALYFPDPWPKRAHAQKRFFSLRRWKQFALLLKPGGSLHFKTDQVDYFDWVLKSFEEVKDQWKVVDLSRHLHRAHPDPESLSIPEVTLFEKLFIRKKWPIYQLRVETKVLAYRKEER